MVYVNAKRQKNRENLPTPRPRPHVKRLGGKIDAAERCMMEGDECAGILMLLGWHPAAG